MMIAEPDCRGQGIAIKVLSMMMGISIKYLVIKKFTVKISFKNEASIHIFKKKFGFVLVSESAVFQEVTLERQVDTEFEDILLAQFIEKEYLVPHPF